MIDVNGRLHSTEKNVNVIAGANEIFDDTKNKKQSQINAEVSEELNFHTNRLNALTSQNYVTVEATNQTTAVTDILPVTGAADTVYRVGKWDGEQYTPTVYSEYAWDGTDYIVLDVKSYGVDDELTPGSDNLAKSGVVYSAINDINLFSHPLANRVIKELYMPNVDYTAFKKITFWFCIFSREKYRNVIRLYISDDDEVIYYLYNKAFNTEEEALADMANNMNGLYVHEGRYTILSVSQDLAGTQIAKVDFTINRDIANLDNSPVIKESLDKELLEASIVGKEASANKVSAWSQIPSDVHYPSEKLVHDTILTPLNSISKTIESGSKNLYDYEHVGVLGGVIATNGDVRQDLDGFYTGKIPVEPNHYYYLSNRGSGRSTNFAMAVRCLDANDNKMKVLAPSNGEEYRNYQFPNVDATNFALNGQFKTPANAAYIQINLTPLYVTELGNYYQIMLEDVGDAYNPDFVPSEYEPYDYTTIIKDGSLQYPVKPLADKVEALADNSNITVKLLCVGSSFTQDEFGYLPFILNSIAPNVKLTIGIAYIGGSPLPQHYAYLTHADSEHKIVSDEVEYWVEDGDDTPYKKFNRAKSELTEYAGYTLYKSVNAEPWLTVGSMLIEDVLTNEDWDIVTYQGAAAQAFKSWDDYYAPYIFEIVKQVNAKVGNNVKLAFNLIHSGYASSDEAFLSRWLETAKNAKKVLQQTGISLLFPSGTAIQNLRCIDALRAMGDGRRHNLLADDAHLQDGIGPLCTAYANALTLLKAVGIDYEGVIGEGTRPDAAWITDNNIPGPNIGSGVIGITDDYCLLAQIAATNAVKYPYSIINPSVSAPYTDRDTGNKVGISKNELSTDVQASLNKAETAVQPATLNSTLSNTVAESGVYDVTANNNNAKFASLSALLSSENLDTLIPSAKRKGGMSIKFVQSSDNKYVQYMYTSSSTATADFKNIANWQEIRNNVITIVSVAPNGDTSGVTGVGQIYYNMSNNKFYICTIWRTSASDATWAEIQVSSDKLILNLSDNFIYTYNGTALVKTANKISISDLSTHGDTIGIITIDGIPLGIKNGNPFISKVDLSFTSGGFYTNTFEVYSFNTCSYVKYDNTHSGEKYVLYKPSSVIESAYTGLLNTDNSVVKSWSGDKLINYELLEITEDGQQICVSLNNSSLAQVYLCKLNYTHNEDMINNLILQMRTLSDGMVSEDEVLSEWVNNSAYSNILTPFTLNNYKRTTYTNTKAGEFYVLYVSGGNSSVFCGLLDTDGTTVKLLLGGTLTGINYALIPITADNQTICVSKANSWDYKLIKLLYTQSEQRLDVLEKFNPKFWEEIPINWIEGGFITTLLTVYSPFASGKYFEYSNTHAGEKYIIYSSGTMGDFTQGLRGTGGQVIKKWTGGLVNWELLEITEDGQTICMCCPKRPSEPNPWKSRIIKINYYKNELDILDLKSRINKLAAPATSSVPGLGVLDIAYPNFDYNHIITYGQSFSEGAGGVGKYDIIPGNYMIGNNVQISGKTDRSQLNGLSSASNGTIATQCTNAFSLLWRRYRNPSAKFVASAGGHGGANLSEISKGTTYYTQFLAEIQALKDIATAENKTAGCIAILFIQGESGGGTGYSAKDSYKYLLDKLKNDMQEDIMSIYGQDAKPVFITYQTGLYEWFGSNGGKIYPQAQLEYAMDNEDVILGCPSYFAAFTTTNHPSGNGYSMIGELMSKYLFSVMNAGNRMQSIHPYSFEIKNNSIFISLDVPVPPLVLDTHTVAAVADYGFKVFVNNTDTQISSIDVFGNQIVISMSQDLTNKMVEVYYATKNATGGGGGRGNICDSDNKYMSYQTYGQELQSETMKYYPVDENGRTLYDRRLPLQNWLCNFYKNVRLCFDIHMLKVKVTDTGFANKLNNELGLEVTYSSSNSEVATIGTDGTLTFVGIGWCVITASVTLNGVTYSDTYLLIVES